MKNRDFTKKQLILLQNETNYLNNHDGTSQVVEKSEGSRNAFYVFNCRYYNIDNCIIKSLNRIAKLTKTEWVLSTTDNGKFRIMFYVTFEELPQKLR